MSDVNDRQIEQHRQADAVCAVIVAYFPETGLKELIADLLPQVNGLVVVDNTPRSQRIRNIDLPYVPGKQVCLIDNSENIGVGAALNQGLNKALEWTCGWLLTLDQDSHCYADMVTTLLQVKSSCTPAPAVIGGNYLDERNNKTKVPIGEGGAFLEQKTVITSGCMVDTRFAQKIGGFREDYFIDQLDHEFCLRVRAHGQRVIISRKPVMAHSVGNPGGFRMPVMGLALPEHPPLRKYYIARNTVVVVSSYWRREPMWCLRRIVRLLIGAASMTFLEKNGFCKIRAFAFGIGDGFRRRMGQCQREYLF